VLEDEYKQAEATKFQLIEKAQAKLNQVSRKKSTLVDKLMNEVVDDATFQLGSTMLNEEETKIQLSLDELGDYNHDMKDYISFGAFVLQNLEEVYSISSVAMKQKLLSSILEEKLTFDGEMYRTPKLKEGFAYIYKNIKELERTKTKTGDNLSKASRLVLEAGLEPARPKGHKILSLACLPIPPLERGILIFSSPS
jgi:hypothetical protein